MSQFDHCPGSISITGSSRGSKDRKGRNDCEKRRKPACIQEVGLMTDLGPVIPDTDGSTHPNPARLVPRGVDDEIRIRQLDGGIRVRDADGSQSRGARRLQTPMGIFNRDAFGPGRRRSPIAARRAAPGVQIRIGRGLARRRVLRCDDRRKATDQIFHGSARGEFPRRARPTRSRSARWPRRAARRRPRRETGSTCRARARRVARLSRATRSAICFASQASVCSSPKRAKHPGIVVSEVTIVVLALGQYDAFAGEDVAKPLEVQRLAVRDHAIEVENYGAEDQPTSALFTPPSSSAPARTGIFRRFSGGGYGHSYVGL